MIKSNPFTPQSGWEPKSFSGRKQQVNSFEKNVKEALSGNKPNHMIILGDWGIGKTSLLKQFKKTSQKKGLVASFCPIPKFTEKETAEEVVNLIIAEILKGFPVIKAFEKVIDEIEGAGISIAGFGGHVTRKKKTPPPQILLTEFLISLWKHLETELAVVLIDDIQNFNEIPQVIDILRLVLSREEIILNTNYLFVLSSTPQGWNFFIDKHDPIGRFFRKRETITPLNTEETKEVIIETLKNTGVTFSDEVMDLICKYTAGHPYELQVLCSNLYEAQIKGKVSKLQWDIAFKTTLSDLGDDYFEALYRKATDREEPILNVLCKTKRAMDIKSIQKEMPKEDKNYPIKDVRFYVYRLMNKGLLRSKIKGTYGIIDNMFREYILLQK
ncbi:MAG: ATP-binding protein [Candidatus Omnitrophota bacterium]